MSTQNEAILSKLDKVIDEQHKTNTLLAEVMADNKHRDARIDELEANNVGLRSELDDILMWKVKNEDSIEEMKDAVKRFGPMWKSDQDSEKRKKDALWKYFIGVAMALSISVAGYIFGTMQVVRVEHEKPSQIQEE